MEAERQLKDEEDKVRVLRLDVAKERKATESMRIAGQQEAKRAQLKVDRLTAQLNRQIPACPPTYELLNPVPAGEVAPSAPGSLPILERGLRDLADLRASLQEETQAFRHVIVATANGIRDALAASTGEEARRILPNEFFAADFDAPLRQTASWTTHPAIADARLRALVAETRATLTAGQPVLMRDGSGATESEAEVQEAQRRVERERVKHEAELRDKVKDLEVELAISRGKEEEAMKVVEQMAKLNVGTQWVQHGTSNSRVPSTTDFADDRLREELVRQKRVLDAERDALRDEAMRLQEAKVAFEAAAEAAKAEAAAEAVAAEAAASAARTSISSSDFSLPTDMDNQVPPLFSTPAKHRPVAPSPLSLAASGSPKRSPVKVKRRGPRTPLSRLVLERQHRKSIEAVPRKVSRKVSGGRSVSDVLVEGGKKGNTDRGSPPRKSLTAATAASLAKSHKKPETALKSTTTRTWR